jgi:hypothetical protein
MEIALLGYLKILRKHARNVLHSSFNSRRTSKTAGQQLTHPKDENENDA